jgi:hypothetical protein
MGSPYQPIGIAHSNWSDLLVLTSKILYDSLTWSTDACQSRASTATRVKTLFLPHLRCIGSCIEINVPHTGWLDESWRLSATGIYYECYSLSATTDHRSHNAWLKNSRIRHTKPHCWCASVLKS